MNSTKGEAEIVVEDDELVFPITIPNPFLETDFPANLPNVRVIIGGPPGIGKSLCSIGILSTVA